MTVGIGILCCLDYRWPIDFLSDWHLASGYGGHAGKKKSACITLIYFSLDMFLTALFGHWGAEEIQKIDCDLFATY